EGRSASARSSPRASNADRAISGALRKVTESRPTWRRDAHKWPTDEIALAAGRSTCADRGERTSPARRPRMARDSADRRAHSTSVDRARHASVHFYCARRDAASSRSGLMPDGAGPESDRAAGAPLVSPDDGPTFPVASGSSADPGMKASISGAATVPPSMPEKTVAGRPRTGASGAARAGSPTVTGPGTALGMASGVMAV